MNGRSYNIPEGVIYRELNESDFSDDDDEKRKSSSRFETPPDARELNEDDIKYIEEYLAQEADAFEEKIKLIESMPDPVTGSVYPNGLNKETYNADLTKAIANDKAIMAEKQFKDNIVDLMTTKISYINLQLLRDNPTITKEDKINRQSTIVMNIIKPILEKHKKEHLLPYLMNKMNEINGKTGGNKTGNTKRKTKNPAQNSPL